MIEHLPEHFLELDIKRDWNAGNHNIIFISIGRYYKIPIKLTSTNPVFINRIGILSKTIKKHLNKITCPHDVVDAQLVLRPLLKGSHILGAKIAIRFENEDDFRKYQEKYGKTVIYGSGSTIDE